MLQLTSYNGLMIQLPMFCLSIIGAAAVCRDSANAHLRLGAGAGLLFLAFEVASRGATRIFTGGQWGPRELLPALPAIVAIAAAAVRGEALSEEASAQVSGKKSQRDRLLRLGGMALVSAGLLSTVISIWLLGQQKKEAGRLQELIRSAPAEAILTTKPVMTPHLAAIWGDRPTLFIEDGSAHQEVIESLRAHSIKKYLFVASPGAPVLPGCRRWARLRGRHVHYSDSNLFVCHLKDTAG
jgi:hypothetical protein